MSEPHPLIIIGSGPARYTAALYTARANLAPVVIEGVQSGGSLMTTDVENFPGFPDGITGSELMDNLRKQADRFGAQVLTDDVTRVDLTGDIKTAWVGDQAYHARTVVLASGSTWRPLGVPREQELLGHGVSSCATCDGFFSATRTSPSSAAATPRWRKPPSSPASPVASRSSTAATPFAASRIMADRAFINNKIMVVWNRVVEEILGRDGIVAGVRVHDVRTGEERLLDVTAGFVASGHDPGSELFRGQVDLNPDGYVTVHSPSTRTDLPGVFAAGDLVDHTCRQAITAAGNGCAADAERYPAANC